MPACISVTSSETWSGARIEAGARPRARVFSPKLLMLVLALLVSWPLPAAAQAFMAVHGTGLAFGRKKILRQHVKRLNPSLFQPKGGKAPKTKDHKPPPVKQDSAGKPPAAKDHKPPPVRQDSAGKPRAAQPKAPELKPFTLDNFRENLGRLTGGIPKDAQAHHVLPQAFEPQFRKAGINIHDPRYGAWWRTSAHQKAAKAYNKEWREFLFDKPELPSREQILQFGRKMAKDHGLQIHF